MKPNPKLNMKKTFSKILIAATLILSSTSANAYDCADPKAFVTSVRDAVLNIINSKSSDADKHNDLNRIFLETADTQWMGKFVLGRNYTNLTPEQQKIYSDAYSEYLASSYVDRFKQYNGETINVSGVKPNNNDFNVDTVIDRPGKAPVNVTYRIRKIEECYKVEDIVAEGVSLIQTQRQDFAATFNSRGFDGLVELLKDKTKQINAAK